MSLNLHISGKSSEVMRLRPIGSGSSSTSLPRLPKMPTCDAGEAQTRRSSICEAVRRAMLGLSCERLRKHQQALVECLMEQRAHH